jgi:hypothetical protein
VADLEPGTDDPGDAGAYCRAVEAHLCRRNVGHLVRIVGPSFDLVSGWAARGVPLRVACLGIDRYVDRQAAKSLRRRPIRVEHCEADVLDVFDEWRRAVGAPRIADDEDATPARRAGSLPAHLERVVARLTALQARHDVDRAVRDLAAAIARELDASVSTAKGVRGDVRTALLTRLAELDARLLEAARTSLAADLLAELTMQAEQELSQFRDRMTAHAHATAKAALVDRLVRERCQLPFVALE